jgi:hypothetical protein
MHQRGLLDWPGSPRAQYHKANVLKARDSVFARRGSDLVALDTVGNSAAVRRVRSCPSTPRHNPPFGVVYSMQKRPIVHRDHAALDVQNQITVV